MLSIRTTFLWIALVGSMVTVAQAQLANSQLKNLGLESAWLSQARIPLDGMGIISADLWVDSSVIRKFAVVDLPGYPLVKVPTDLLDAKNQPIGAEKAQAEAKRIAARMLGKSDGIDVAEIAIPEIKLVVVTSSGLVQCFDAETGKLQWATPCGSTNVTTLPAAFSNLGVSLIQGDYLYLLDWTTGKQMQKFHLPNFNSSSLVVLDSVVEPVGGTTSAARPNSMALVSDYRGQVSDYGFHEQTLPWNDQLIGRSELRPVASPDRTMVAIPTNTGKVYVYTGNVKPRVLYRYEASSGITRSLSSGSDGFYIGSLDGTLTKVSFDGKIVWSFHLSYPIDQPALLDTKNGLVFVATESGELTAIDDATGYEAWPKSVRGDVFCPIALSGSNVLCKTVDDRLIAFDRKSGQPQGITTNMKLGKTQVINSSTDRTYLISSKGQIQCLRPIGKDLPTLVTAIQAKPKEKRPVEAEPSSEPAATEATSADPFGAMNEPAGDATTADPFGADPFAGSDP